MNPLLSQHKEALQHLCRTYHFDKLWVFGSILTPQFDDASDIDFLYELGHEQLPGDTSIDYFFRFIEEAQTLLGHPIELVWYPGIRNPFFKEEIEETKVLIYDAAAEKVSV